MTGMLATTDKRDRRMHSERKSADSYRRIRVHYRLEDDVVMPTPCTIVAFAKTQEGAAKAVAEEVDGAVPIYTEEFEIGERSSFREILGFHGYDVKWSDS